MTREDSIRQIENYPPFNEQEEKDKALILGWIRNNENAFSRENTVAHITASAWVVNKDRSKVLMVYHNIYNSWSWLGGHADGETDLLSVAIREVKEEAGLDVSVKSVIAIQDREKHNLPVYAYRVCKIFMLCAATGGGFEENIETTGFDYFAEDELPELAGEKNNEEQIRMCFDAYRAGDKWKTFFD